jgi:capsular exopolysaccharide synthesis family protein
MSELPFLPFQDQDAPQVPARYNNAAQSAPPLPPDVELEQEKPINLLDYLRVIVKRRWIIMTVTLAVVMITAIVTWKATPIYRATIKIQIDPEENAVLPFKEAMDPGSTYAQSQEYLQTQFKVLASETLADRVIRALDLESNPSFLPEVKPSVTSTAVKWLRSLFSSSEGAQNRPAVQPVKPLYSKYSSALVGNLTVNPVRNSRLVEVSFDSRDPRLAATVVNTLAEQYIDLNFETKYEATTKASDFLARQLTDLKARVEKSEEDLVRFSQQHNIYETSDKENVILQKLADLNAALTAAQADRIQKESVWNIARPAAPGEFPQVLRSDLIKELETNVANLRVEQARLKASFKPGWPQLDQVTGQLTEAEAQLKAEQNKAIKNVETEYRTALNREQLLGQALDAQKAEASDLNENSIQYNILKRQVDTDKQLYDGLLQRLKEAEVSAGLKSSNIHVVDAAEPPGSPYKPNKPLNLGLALTIGLILGVGLAFFTENLDSSLKTPADIDRYLGLPSLGVIPMQAATLAPQKSKLLLAGASNAGLDANAVELVAHYNPRSLLAEAYRSLRTSILLSSNNGSPPRVILVTSSQQGEGKTTTAINIAITLAQTGGQVILLDCDMRNPRVHRALNLKSDAGMSTYLSGQSDLPPLIQKTEVANLFAVSVGRIPPNPAELVGSSRMKEGLALLAESFSYIVIDSPPVLAVTDARILGAIVDGVILVLKGGETPRQAARMTRRLLHEVHARIIGTLLNDVDIYSTDYSYYARYYYYGYGKRYGYGRKYGYGKKYGYGYGYGKRHPDDETTDDHA